MQRLGLGAPVEKNASSLHAHSGVTWHDSQCTIERSGQAGKIADLGVGLR